MIRKNINKIFIFALSFYSALSISILSPSADETQSDIIEVIEFINQDDPDLFTEAIVNVENKTVTIDGTEVAPDEFIEGLGLELENSSIDVLLENSSLEVQAITETEYSITSPYQTKRLIIIGSDVPNTYDAVDSIYSNSIGVTILKYDSEEKTKLAHESLLNDGLSCFIDEVIVAEDITATQQTYLSKNWGHQYMNFDDLMAANLYTSPGFTIAVLDTGLDSSHDLFKNRVSNKSYNFIDNNTVITDGRGHGTHVAGIIAAATPTNIDLMILKILDDNGRGTSTATIAAMIYAAENNAKIANLSLSTEGQGNYASLFDSVLEKKQQYDITYVSSAGNKQTDANGYYPGALSYIVTVSALKSDGTFDSSYSNYGSCVDFCAPGSLIYSTYAQGKHANASGTSQAAPHVTAAFANILAIEPSLNSTQLKEKAITLTVDLGAAGKDDYYGYGYIDLAKLIPNNPNSGGSVVDPIVPTIIDISTGTITIQNKNIFFDGNPKKPRVIIDIDGAQLTTNDYSVEYSNNINVGRATVTVTGKGNYKGQLTSTFAIKAAPISGCIIELNSSTFEYTGSEIKPTIKSIKNSSGTNIDAQYYKINYKNNINPGNGSIIITGQGGLNGEYEIPFTISKANINSCQITLSKTSFGYTGCAIKPTVSVTINGKRIYSGFGLSYKNNINAGTATVTITGNTLITGSKTFEYEITPRNLSLVSLELVENSENPNKPYIYLKDGPGHIPTYYYNVIYQNSNTSGYMDAIINNVKNYSGSLTKSYKKQ